MLLVDTQVIETIENIYAAPAHRTAVDPLLQLPVWVATVQIVSDSDRVVVCLVAVTQYFN